MLPILKSHRKLPRSVVWAPKGLGGLELNTNIYNVQAQCALMYLVRTMRWDKIVAKDILATLNAAQLASGFGTPILETTFPKIKYIGKGWILNLREMLDLFDIQVWIEDAWRPRKQRQYDRALQEDFANDEEITPKMERLANEFRMWMRVTWLSELATIDGREIPIERIQNGSDWQAIPETGYTWPNTVQPTNKHREAFRKCLRLCYCPNANKYTRTENYALQQPLGKWYPAPRQIQFLAYRSKKYVYYRDEMGLHCCKEERPGFFPVPLETVARQPIASHPIEPNMSSQSVFWTRRPRRLIIPYTAKQVRFVTRNDLPEGPIERIDVVSDASVHTEKEKGAITWQAVTEDDRRLSMDIPIEVPRHSYSYRHELMGIYEGLSGLLQRRKDIKKITCHCDNEAGIEKVKSTVRNPGAMTAADMDVVLAIQKLVHDNTAITITFQHVQGHADKKKMKSQCTKIEQLNIECDEEAELRVQKDHPPTPYSPLPGAKCMVKIQGTWISSRIDKAIQLIPAAEAQKKYIREKLGISEDAVKDIDTETIAAARAGHLWNRTARITKMMNKWLPVGHNWRHHGADNDKCPGCGTPDETFAHLFQCPNTKLRVVCQEAMEHISKAGASLKIPVSIMWLLLRILKHECKLEENTPPPDRNLRDIWEAQKEIGFQNFITGWISRSWQRGLRYYESKDPGGQAAQILTLIWDGLCEPIWACRNDIHSNNANPKEVFEMDNLRDKLRWYKKYSKEVLPERFRFMVDFSNEEITYWDRDKRRGTVRILEKASKIYEIECKQRVKGQRVIIEFFQTK